ncbi:MAG: hypothetical protein ACRC14_08120 [Paracoccaceae bacterium]
MTMIAPPVWHYPRPGFTQSVFQTLVTGGADAMRLFGPRRIGKTQFLLYDLGYRAVTQGHRAVYVSLWQNIPAPIETIILECERAVGGRTVAASVATWLGESKTRLEVNLWQGTGTIEHPGKAVQPADPWARLRKVLDRLSNPQRPSLLFLDEFQTIADHPDARNLLNRLRVELERSAAGVKVVFSGSSVNKLRRIFEADKTGTAAFQDFALPMHLPRLDDGFVPHMLTVARKELFSTIPQAEAQQVFADCDRNPELFRSWVIRRSTNPQTSLADIVFDMSDKLDFQSAFDRLSPRARTAARMIAEQVDDPRGKAGAAWWLAFTGAPSATPAQRGTDLKTLVDRDLIHSTGDRGQYVMTDPAFAKWLRMQPKAAFLPGGQT